MLTEFMALTAIFHKSRIGSPSCSLHGRDSMSGLPLYRIVQGSMVDYRCDVPRSLRSLTLWLGFSGRLLRHFIQGHQVSHARGASRDGGQTTVSRRWWLAMLPGETTEGPTRVKIMHVFSSHRLHFDRLVRSTRRRFWRCWQDEIAQLRTQDPQACASRIRRCFRVPTTQHVPHGTMQWRAEIADHTRPCDGWRAHFSSVNTSSTHEDFSADFYSSMTGRFFELTADRSPGDFDAPFSASELSRALNFCHDSTPGQDGLPYRAFQSHLPWWRASLLLFFNLVLEWNVVPSAWKLSHVVPVFKHGDASDLCIQNFRAIGTWKDRTSHLQWSR